MIPNFTRTPLTLAMLAATAVLVGLTATAALADDDEDAVCTNEPQSAWMPVPKLEETLVSQGYEVRSLKLHKHCVEAYVITPEKHKAELNLNPVTGEIVEVDDHD